MKMQDLQEKNKVLDLIKKITFEIESAKPSKKQMIEDVKMMNFKIRPLIGDVFDLVKKEVGFLESLWKIGKIEEIVSGGVSKLNNEEKEIFFRYLDDFQNQMERKISSIIKDLPAEESKNMRVLELEIVKERKKQKKSLN